jgi:hypothetical protein
MVIFTTFQASCNSLKCKTPNRDGFFTSGPALPGTDCGSSMVKLLGVLNFYFWRAFNFSLIFKI